MNRKKIIALASGLALTLTINFTAYADPSLNNDLQSQRQKLNDAKNNYDSIQNQIDNLENDIRKLNNDISVFMLEIEKNNKEISSTETKIKNKEEELQKAQLETEKEKKQFNKRMRTLYMNGTGSYIQILFTSNGVSDLISKVEAVKRVADFDKELIAKLKVKEEVVAEKKTQLEEQKTKLLALKAENESKLAKINDNKAKSQTLVADLKSKQQSYASVMNDSEQQINKIKTRLEEIKRQEAARAAEAAAANANKNNNPSRGDGGSSVPVAPNSIVAYAYNFIGTPYVWGANGPGSFDCSGFTRYVYGNFGVNLPRVAADQQNFGTSVSRSDLQPGDLVFFGYPAYHVGIYVGDNAYIHAPEPGDSVKISRLGSGFSSAVRIR